MGYGYPAPAVHPEVRADAGWARGPSALDWIVHRLSRPSIRADRSASLAGERGGRLDRYDVLMVVGLDPRGCAGPRLQARAAGGDVLRRGLPRPHGDRVPAGLGVRAAARHLRVHPPPPGQVRHGLGHPAGRGQRGHRHRAARRPRPGCGHRARLVDIGRGGAERGRPPLRGHRLGATHLRPGQRRPRQGAAHRRHGSGHRRGQPHPLPRRPSRRPLPPGHPGSRGAPRRPGRRWRPGGVLGRPRHPGRAACHHRHIAGGRQRRIHQHLRHRKRGAALGTLLVRRLRRPGAALGGACRRRYPPAL